MALLLLNMREEVRSCAVRLPGQKEMSMTVAVRHSEGMRDCMVRLLGERDVSLTLLL